MCSGSAPGTCGSVEMSALTLQRALAIIALLVLGAACASLPESSARSTDLVSNTWSVVGVDVNTREVGAALATCIEAQHRITASKLTIAERGTSTASYSVHGVVSGGPSFELARLVGGIGAIVAQGLVDPANVDRLDRATAQLVAGASAGSVIEAAKIDDPRSEERQYAVVTLLPDVSSFTGNSTENWAGAQVADVVSVQGNVLVGPEVIEEAVAAFGRVRGRPGATLGDALMSALEAGAAEGGDKRCPKLQSALAAFIVVVRADDVENIPHLWFAAPPQRRGGANPVKLLRESYDGTPSALQVTPSSEGTPLYWWAVAILAPALVGLAFWAARRPSPGARD